MPIIIIESPNKTEKISKYSGFKTIATKGHFKALSKDIFISEKEEEYEPKFVSIDKNSTYRINEIINASKNEEVFIATDPDREGYAIGFMVYLAIKNHAKSIKRAEFFEITQEGIQKGLKEAIDFHKTNFKDFESYKARAVSDKMVGFILSPKYINKLNDKNISVGRVQTPALNLIVERELKIKDFLASTESKKIEYKIKAKLKKDNMEFQAFNDNLFANKEEAQNYITNTLSKESKAKLFEKESKESKINPKAPYRTSQFQEAINKAYGFNSEKAMALAQSLFEKGLITYHRTDSNALSNEFIDEMQNLFQNEKWYEKRIYKAGEQSQAQAHEAIRITHAHSLDTIKDIVKKESLSDEEEKAYTLIYLNSLASQGKTSLNENITYDFNILGLSFKAKSSKCIFKGFKELYELNKEALDEENEEVQKNKDTQEESQTLDLNLNPNEEVEILSFELVEVKAKAPTRYKESNFISLLEKEGIGRPSTYASFLPKLLQRAYIEIEKKGKNSFIKATQKGLDFMKKIKEFDEWISKSEYTKQMENMLDSISKGEVSYLDYIKAIHEKMEFAKINACNPPPSQKALDYAISIGKTLNIDLPQGIENNYKICQAFINENKDKLPQKEIKPPSQKQIALAKDLAQKQNIELPKDYESNMKICSEFITKCFETQNKTQKQTKKKGG
ncbi:type IA DNA topoisomerase [Campylobacter upsaliensis]|nr:type IA DNA topoisomerase [Campylobacter upsaliensis]